MNKIPESKYYQFSTEEEMKRIESSLQTQGYSLPSDKVEDAVTFEKIQQRYGKNKTYLINSYYNFLNKKIEYVFTTKQIEKSIYSKIYSKTFNIKRIN